MKRPRRDTIVEAAPGSARDKALAALVVFATALLVRLLFWQAAPDRDWPYSAWLKGDGLVWLEYARALRQGTPFELGLPIRPPGTAYVMAALWNGEAAGIPALKAAWALIGSLTALLVYVAAARSFGLAVGVLAGLGAAVSTGLMVLSTSLDSEAPYLLLVTAALCLNEDLLRGPRAAVVAAWSALGGLACMFRVEHALFFVLMVGYWFFRWHRSAAVNARARRGATLAGALLSLVVFALTLLPWQLAARRAIVQFNADAATPPHVEAALGRVERRLRDVTWEPEALERRDRLPPFARRTAAGFVAAAVAHRGGRRVRADDFALLREAFGYEPRPLFPYPLVSSYGPLNFALANHAAATGGFSRAPLEEPPPLSGGAGRYPPDLVRGLPPPDLSLTYPPHLRLVNEGYAVGWQWIRSHPAAALRLAARKLRRFWSGAALGATGENLPLGLSGTRRPVDLVVPDDSPVAAGWRLAVLGACVLGAAAGWRNPSLHPWLLFLLSRTAVALAFFGYARLGATTAPVVALLAALAADRWILRGRRLSGGQILAAALLVAVLAMAVEARRWWRGPAVRIDGRPIDRGDPFPADLHGDRRIDVGG